MAGDLRLTEGEAIVEGEIAVAAHGTLSRVFAVGGHWFAEIAAGPDGRPFTAPLRAVRLQSGGPVQRPTLQPRC